MTKITQILVLFICSLTLMGTTFSNEKPKEQIVDIKQNHALDNCNMNDTQLAGNGTCRFNPATGRYQMCYHIGANGTCYHWGGGC
jgi:hypothetical protein